jgi:phosphotransferase system HPr (HPr) family protein
MTGRAGGTGPASRGENPPATRTPPPAKPPEKPPEAPPVAAPGGSGPIRRTIRIVNPLGIHMRVADRFSKVAKQYSCSVIVWNGEARANGTNIWDLIGLLVMQDADVILEVDGPDAATAVEPLAEILASPGGEDYTI